MTSLLSYILIAIGSAMGGTARFWLATAIGRWTGSPFPWGTIIVNVSGSLAIGFFAAMTGPEGRVFVPTEWRQFFMIGICGGYTTFSSFSLQTLNLAQDGDWLGAAGNVVLSVVLCLLGVWLGFMAAQLASD